MKKILYIAVSLLLLLAGGVAEAQVGLVPSTLTWGSGDTQTKSVRVTSSGWWQADSTVVSNHFTISPQNGSSGSYLYVTPMSPTSKIFTAPAWALKRTRRRK